MNDALGHEERQGKTEDVGGREATADEPAAAMGSRTRGLESSTAALLGRRRCFAHDGLGAAHAIGPAEPSGARPEPAGNATLDLLVSPTGSPRPKVVRLHLLRPDLAARGPPGRRARGYSTAARSTMAPWTPPRCP